MKTKRIITAALSVILAVGLFSGCGETPEQKAVKIYNKATKVADSYSEYTYEMTGEIVVVNDNVSVKSSIKQSAKMKEANDKIAAADIKSTVISGGNTVESRSIFTDGKFYLSDDTGSYYSDASAEDFNSMYFSDNPDISIDPSKFSVITLQETDNGYYVTISAPNTDYHDVDKKYALYFKDTFPSGKVTEYSETLKVDKDCLLQSQELKMKIVDESLGFERSMEISMKITPDFSGNVTIDIPADVNKDYRNVGDAVALKELTEGLGKMFSATEASGKYTGVTILSSGESNTTVNQTHIFKYGHTADGFFYNDDITLDTKGTAETSTVTGTRKYANGKMTVSFSNGENTSVDKTDDEALSDVSELYAPCSITANMIESVSRDGGTYTCTLNKNYTDDYFDYLIGMYQFDKNQVSSYSVESKLTAKSENGVINSSNLRTSVTFTYYGYTMSVTIDETVTHTGELSAS